MLRFLAQSALTLLGNALGLLITSILLPDFSISGFGFLVSVGFFTLAHILLSPFVFKIAVKYTSQHFEVASHSSLHSSLSY